MEVNAKAKFIRMSPRKVRLVVDVIRGLEVNKALDQLKFTKKWASKPIIKLINSAVANALNNFELDKNNLYIKEIRVDEGPTSYRWRPRAYGRATPIRKRTSHISLVLAEVKDSGKREAKKQKVEAPIKLGEKPKEEKGVKVEEKKEGEEKLKETIIEKGLLRQQSETSKKVIDPRLEGRGGHTKIEGKSHRGFVDKIFRRKSG
jgi:large subunit ribosomal protein L22